VGGDGDGDGGQLRLFQPDRSRLGVSALVAAKQAKPVPSPAIDATPDTNGLTHTDVAPENDRLVLFRSRQVQNAILVSRRRFFTVNFYIHGQGLKF
jgi:hypothetical protein